MKSTKGKAVVLSVAVIFAVAPVMAQETNSTDDTEIDGTDNSTEITVEQSVALETAEGVLSDMNWTLEESSVHEEDGYYRFRFTVSGLDAEAEVRVDGSSGEVFEHEEEIEQDSETDEELKERVEEEREEARQEAIDARIEAKQRKIEFYRERISELQEEITALKNGELAPEEDEENESEIEKEFEFKREGDKVEAEAEIGEREAEVEAEGNVNGTPGSEQAQESRPGFVNDLLGGLFG